MQKVKQLLKLRGESDMICYRDRSYCSESENCANVGCGRRFTEQDAIAGEKWWGSKDFPVAYMDCKTDDCGFERKEKYNE